MPVERPDWERPEYTDGAEERVMTATLKAGTRAMRLAREVFLPKEEGESERSYEARLKRSNLWGAFGKTVTAMTGVAYRRPIQVTDTPEDMIPWFSDVDRAGTALQPFFEQVIAKQMQTGLHLVLVNYPPVSPEVTAADEMIADIRPYLLHLDASRVHYWKTARRDGKQVIVEVRFFEQIETDSGDGSIEYQWYIRRLTLSYLPAWMIDTLVTGVELPPDSARNETARNVVIWEQYKQKESAGDSQDQQPEWELFDSGVMDIPEIPIVAFYGQKIDTFVGKSPLLDLAYLNVQHWQKQSDIDNIEHFALVPVLGLFGFNEDDGKMVISVARTFRTENADGRIEWIEYGGSAITIAHASMDRLEARMARVAMKMLSDETDNVATSATERLIDKAESDADLSTVVVDHVNGIAECLRLMALWTGREIDPTVSLDASFEFANGSPEALTALVTLATAIGLPEDVVLTEAVRRGWLPSDTDVKALVARLKEVPTPGVTAGPPA